MAGRRQVLIGLGGALVAGAAAGTWRVTRMPQTAQTPWLSLNRPVADPRLDAFRHAILAPNPHNRQPWLIRLEGSDAAVLSCDLDKRLPQTDPFDRQITIGFGTFIELAAIAASKRGLRLEVEPFPDGEPQPRLDHRPVARLRFISDGAPGPDPLARAIALRRTNRQTYRPLPPGLLEQIGGEGMQASADPALLAQVRKLTVAAITREMETHQAHMESVRLMRIGHREVDANPDGLALTGPLIEGTSLLGLTNRESLADPASTSFRLGLEDLQKVHASVPAVLWLVTPDNSRLAQLAAGRRYARTCLRAAAAGAAMHPMSQALQEYPAMADLYTEARQLLGAQSSQCVQMLSRVGMASPVIPSARYPLEAHLRR
ncbi:hypothetical protein [Novosphingobium sp.]|uniref:Acg family FMN-binding oxidoreductase n=1 Tax=Novosphingobium sp. TaxID=1874826 RepID=UPI0025DAF0CE|nr:hypothetical protein [Novosphingobium sp.]MCC6926759.1 hypothetical protein [Novosphingobium sp.]